METLDSSIFDLTPFPMPNESNQAGDAVHNQVRPKPEQYADRTWMPPRGTRRSMGKR